jgi:homoserine kinase
MKASPSEAVGRAYCSTANLGAGYDVFGLALDKYSDTVQVRLTQDRRIRIVATGPYGRSLPRDPRKNSAGPPSLALLKRARAKRGLVIIINKNVPPGLGLGSSGATSAACTKTLDDLLDLKLSNDDLVETASLGEKAVSGSAHADNVAASLLGGFTAVYDIPRRVTSLKPTSRLTAVVATPRLKTQPNKTQKARSLVPKKVETKKAVLNVGRASAIVAGFATGNIDMIGAGMRDEIAEPYRESMIPGCADVKRLALEAGAAGVSISGAGPSLIALLDRTRYDPGPIGRAMVAGFAKNNVRSTWFVARPAIGATIIRKG